MDTDILIEAFTKATEHVLKTMAFLEAEPQPVQTKSDDSTEKKEELPEEGPLPSEADAVADDKDVDMQPVQGRPPVEAYSPEPCRTTRSCGAAAPKAAFDPSM